jgi:hypothetical protein
MAESKREEHQHLQARTDALKEEHAGLALDKTPYSQASHDKHKARLKKLKADLVRHRNRPDDPVE